MQNLINEIVTGLTSGITSFATAFGTGIQNIVTSLFCEMTEGQITGLSSFGIVVIVFAGVSLVIGITTRIFMWITSLGN